MGDMIKSGGAVSTRSHQPSVEPETLGECSAYINQSSVCDELVDLELEMK
jgi:hypothetical protein